MKQIYRLTNPVGGYAAEKVTVIKAIRFLGNLGLREAKEMSESSVTVTIIDPDASSDRIHKDSSIKEIRAAGGVLVGNVAEILDGLRKLATLAIEQEEDELGNEILQFVLAEKLKRKDIL